MVDSITRCALKEIWRSNKRAPYLPKHPSARVGSVAHYLLERAKTGEVLSKETFEKLWNRKIEEAEAEMSKSICEKHLVPLSDSFPYYEVRKIQTWNTISSFSNEDVEWIKDNGHSAVETLVYSRDHKVVGRLDLVNESDNFVQIIDYKTGRLTDQSGQLRKEYRTQMLMYAALYHDTYKRWPNELKLLGLNRSKYSVTFDPEECDLLLRGSIERLDEINQKIMSGVPETEFAFPSPEACRFCGFRPGCKEYWNKRADTEEWPIDVIGEIVEETTSRMGNVCIAILSNNVTYKIWGLSNRHGLDDSVGKSLCLCNLSRDRTGNSYVENQMTTSIFMNKLDSSRE